MNTTVNIQDLMLFPSPTSRNFQKMNLKINNHLILIIRPNNHILSPYNLFKILKIVIKKLEN